LKLIKLNLPAKMASDTLVLGGIGNSQTLLLAALHWVCSPVQFSENYEFCTLPIEGQHSLVGGMAQNNICDQPTNKPANLWVSTNVNASHVLPSFVSVLNAKPCVATCRCKPCVATFGSRIIDLGVRNSFPTHHPEELSFQILGRNRVNLGLQPCAVF
jgi:hypothetical protein